MPIYIFCCIKCNHEFEKIQAMKDSNPECPECRGETRRLISKSSFRLNGEGWEKDGYQKKE
ncbi:zinc ribbon domain-containing protein [Candidatus Pacearchaeota archaeon]|nr:zinc ribbon domain-containing protein [Candidatus Pacearchaeota archaeon]